MRYLSPATGFLAVALGLPACSFRDSRTARQAENSLVGLSVVDLESCIGVPNRRDTFDHTSILTYDGNSTSSGGMSVTLPVMGDVNFSGGGYCHLNIRLDNGRVTYVRYTGETDAPLAPEAYCAPLVRSCLRSLRPVTPPAPSSTTGPAASTPPAASAISSE